METNHPPITDVEERILLEDELTLLDLPGGEESPPLARRLPDDERRTGWLVDLPVLGLTLLAAVGNLPADTTLQLIFRDNFTEVARVHLLFTL